MPQDLDFALYFNIFFISVLGMGILVGFLKGLKNAMWGFFATLILYVVFFLTLDQVVNMLWTVSIPGLGSLLANVSPDLSSVTTLSEALPAMVEQFLGAEYLDILANENVLEFVTTIALFVVKIVYFIVYFIVIQLIYRLILWILKIIIFPSRKKTDKYRSKNRGFGAIFGLLRGVLSAYVSLILFGGLISIVGSLVDALPAPEPEPLAEIVYAEGFGDPTQTLLAFDISSLTGDQTIEEAYDLMNDMVTAFNENIVVTFQNEITMPSEYTGDPMPMNLYLFDEVMSMTYQDQQIAFREEIDIYADVAGTLLNSDFIESMDYADITGQDIRDVFAGLSESNLLTSVIPVGLEVGATMFETDIEIPTDDLFEIEWDTELMQLGEIAATAFDIINAAGILNEQFDLETVTLDGEDVENLFIELGESQLVTLAAYVAIEPLLAEVGGTIQAVITVPEDIDWADEFAAIGALAGEVLDTGLTIGDINEGDIGAIFGVLSEIDFTILLDSKIITNAMINILSGNVPELANELSMIVIPDDIVWLDTYVDGVLVPGELYNILNAVNLLTSSLSGIDFSDLSNLDLQTIADLDFDAINALFESRILVATITSFVRDLPLGDDITIIMPDSVFDEDGYILKTELQNIVTAVGMLFTELACEVDDPDCSEFGVDFYAALTLAEEDIVTLLASDILAATVGGLIIDMAGEMLTIPDSATTEVLVDGVPQDVVSREEITNVFLAVSAIGITDIDELEIDLTILNNLGLESDPTVLDPDKADLLFGSIILNATLSSYLIGFSEEVDAFVVIPYLDQDENVIRITDGDIEYISEDELTNILEAVLALDLTDMENFESLDISLIIDNIAVLLDSAILHATVSKQLLDLTDVVTVPQNDQLGDPLQITTGPVGFETTFIAKTELQAAIDALSVLGINDIQNVDFDVSSLLNNLGTEADPTILDQDKADLLFASSIINATLSSFIIEFADEEDAFIVVPYLDEDGVTVRTEDPVDGTKYISQDELTNILEAILILDLQDFENVETLSLDTIINNVSVLLDSAILHATVSKQLLDLTDVVTVPLNDQLGNPLQITNGPVGHETTFIAKAELQAAFDALSVLGLTDIQNVSIDVSIMNNLGTEADPTILDSAKADTLFSSSIINATLSGYIIDFTDSEDPFIVVPFEDQDGVVVRTIDLADGTEYITQEELTNILEAILILDLQDFDSVETLSLDTLLTNIGTMLDSAILHASISKQLVDLGSEVVTIPLNDQFGDPLRITTGPVGNETEFVSKDELIATFDALEVLGISDISSLSIDVSILNNLGTEEDETVLDTDKADILFGSSIINATLSSYIIDFSSGEDPFIVVPFEDQDGTTIRTIDAADGTEYITQAELTNIMKSILALNLQDFDSVETLSLDSILANVDVMMDSAIMQASISKQLIDLGTDVVVIPDYHANDDELIITRGTVDFIDRDELVNTFNALEVLGLTDITTMNVDITILNNLGTEADPTILDPVKADTLFASTILTATISKYIIDFSEGDSPVLLVPQKDEDDVYIKTVSSMDGTNYISEDELTNLLGAILALNLTDFGNVTTLDFGIIISNKDALIASTIIQATISDQLFDLGAGIMIIPEVDEDGLDVMITTGDAGQEISFIVKDELGYLFDALEVLGFTEGLDAFDGGFDLEVLDEPGAITTLVASTIIQATISDQIFDLAEDGGAATLVIIPYETPDGLTDLRVTVGTVTPVELIIREEVEDMLSAFVTLGFTDVNNMSNAISISTLSDNAAEIFESYIIQATVSNQVLDLESSEIVIPYWDDNLLTPGQLRFTSGPVGFETEFIEKNELIHLMEALDVIIPEGDGVSTFGGSIDVTLFYEVGPRTTLITSYILQASISKQIIDLGSSAIDVPTLRDDGSTVVRLTAGAGLEATEYLVDDEIHALFEALEVLGIGDFGDFDGSTMSFDIFMPSHGVGYEANQNALLGSACIQATVSTQIIDLGTAVVIPAKDYDEATVTVATGGVTYIVVDEIKYLFNALDVLGFSVSDFGGELGLTTLFASSDPNYDTNQDTLLTSAIMHATMADQISSMDGGAIVIPSTDILDTAITKTIETYFFIDKDEIKNLINALDALGFSGNLDGFGGGLDFGVLSDGTTQDTLLLSVIMHATISDQIYDLSQGATPAVIIPSTDVGNTSIQTTVSGNYFIETVEIKALLDAMDVLGISGDLSTFGGGIGLSSLFASTEPVDYGTNQDTVLASAIMHRTITNQIADLDGTAIVLATTDRDGVAVDTTVSTNYFILKSEIKHLFDAMDILGVSGDLSAFDGAIDMSNLFDSGSQDTLLLSAIMHATISDQIYDLSQGATPAILIPSTDSSDTAVHVTVSTVYFIEKVEIKALLDAMDVLGISGDLSSFGGSIGLSNLFASTDPVNYGSNQDTVLASAIMHRTITDQIADLDGTALVVSTTDIDGTDIDTVVSTNFFILKSEIKHLFNAMDVLGVSGDLASFDGTIDLSLLANSSSQDTLLLSAIMHATLSDKLFDTTLDIPDVDINRAVTIRVTQAGVEFLEKTEMKALLTSLDALGLTDYSSMDLDISDIYSTNLNTLLASASMQASISQEILPTAKTYGAASSGELIVPNDLREDITIETVSTKWIEKNELIALITAFDTMNLSGFGVTLSGSTLSGYSSTQINTILQSDSMYLTVEKMIKSNANVNTYIPDVAGQVVIVDSYLSIANVISVTEVENFILAINVMGGDITGDITTGVLSGLSYTDQQTVITSYIARCRLTADFTAAMIANGTPYGAGDYETLDTTPPAACVTYDAAEDALALI